MPFKLLRTKTRISRDRRMWREIKWNSDVCVCVWMKESNSWNCRITNGMLRWILRLWAMKWDIKGFVFISLFIHSVQCDFHATIPLHFDFIASFLLHSSHFDRSLWFAVFVYTFFVQKRRMEQKKRNATNFNWASQFVSIWPKTISTFASYFSGAFLPVLDRVFTKWANLFSAGSRELSECACTCMAGKESMLMSIRSIDRLLCFLLFSSLYSFPFLLWHIFDAEQAQQIATMQSKTQLACDKPAQLT